MTELVCQAALSNAKAAQLALTKQKPARLGRNTIQGKGEKKNTRVKRNWIKAPYIEIIILPVLLRICLGHLFVECKVGDFATQSTCSVTDHPREIFNKHQL